MVEIICELTGQAGCHGIFLADKAVEQTEAEAALYEMAIKAPNNAGIVSAIVKKAGEVADQKLDTVDQLAEFKCCESCNQWPQLFSPPTLDI